ncbi:MAG: choice-of-anchor B family protein [Phycisphaerales bacterium]|jgi:choice-of-anchor B domain-containing protein|nr:choice-of-anchor B family protein [Phycisphaerales bacterium]
MMKRHARTGALLALLAASAALAHDQDWRKLKDRESPFFGPIVSADTPVFPRQFEAAGLVLESWIPLNNFGTGATSGNDCWGYVSPSGREYAIMGLSNALGFVEITNPSSPVIVGTISGPSSLWRDVKVVGEYAYGVSEGGAGIQVIDLRNIDSGTVTLVQNKTQGGHTTTHNIAANTDTGFLYLCGANVSNGGLVAVNTTNPGNPIIAGAWSTAYVHDAQIVNWTDGPYAGHEIAFCYNGSRGLEIVDVTNKSSMVRIGGTSYAQIQYCHQGWLTPDRRYVILNDELDEGATVSVTTTRVVDVSNLEHPVVVTTYTNNNTSRDHNNYTRGNYTLHANYRSGLRVFDISNPLAAHEVASYDTYPSSDNDNYNGAWSCYPYFPSGNIIVSDIESGLFVLRPESFSFNRLVPSFGVVGVAPGESRLDPGVAFPVNIQVEEEGVTLDHETVVLNVSIDGVPQNVTTTEQLDGSFAASIPGANCFSEIVVSVSARDEAGKLYQSATATYSVYTSDVVSFSDNFETNTGWTVSNVGLTDGPWTRGTPVGGGDRGDPPSDYDGSGQCYLTDNVDGNSDVDGGQTILISPIFDGTAPDAAVSYARWFDNTGSGTGANPGTKTFLVQISNNGGSNWQALETVGPSSSESSGGWFEKSFDLASVITPTSNMRIRFIAQDPDPGSVIEAGVDAFRVYARTCEEPPACDADWDGSGGTPDSSDFLAYLNDYASQNPRADLAPPGGNGTFDSSDFLAFLNIYAQGC